MSVSADRPIGRRAPRCFRLAFAGTALFLTAATFADPNRKIHVSESTLAAGEIFCNGFVQIAAGQGFSLGIRADGMIVAWGDNSLGQTTIPNPNIDFKAVSAGWNHVLGLKSDGTILAWGANHNGELDVPAPNQDFVAVAAGVDHSLGLKADGSIIAWGSNSSGQTTVPIPNTGFVAIGAGYDHSLGLKSNGSIVAWGSDYFGQISIPEPNENFVAVAAGFDYSLGLKADSSIVSWGLNLYGVTSIPAPNTDFVAVAAGFVHGVGLKSNGSVVAWGAHQYGQTAVPWPNTGFVAIAAGGDHSLGLLSDGSVVAWGCGDYQYDFGQCDVPELEAPNCDDNFDCTIDACDQATDSCTHSPHDNACSDGLFCNGIERCDPLIGCVPGAPINCDDDIPCTSDACDDLLGCTHAPNSGQCAQIILQPIRSSGSSTIAETEIRMHSGGQRVFLEVQIRGFAPRALRGYRIRLDAAGYDSGTVGSLSPAVQSCPVPNSIGHAVCQDAFEVVGTGSPRCVDTDPDLGVALQCEPAWLIQNRTDGVFYGHRPFPSVDLSTPSFVWASAVNPFDEAIDDGSTFYAGALAIDIPEDAVGTFTMGFATNETMLTDQLGMRIQPLYLKPARITILCANDAECNDSITCTDDHCDPSTQKCVHVPNHGLCDDGLYCNGSELCDSSVGCRDGVPPDCNDHLACTADDCDEAADACTHAPNDAYCINNLFCDGLEFCDPAVGCRPGLPPCAEDETCDEQTRACRRPEIPTVNAWGLTILGLLLITLAKLQFGRRNPTRLE